MKKSKADIEKLTKLVKACKVIKNEKALEVFDLITDLNKVSRRQLVSDLGFSESPLTKYLLRLESVDLISSTKSGREKELNISSYGRKISEAMGHPIPLKIPYVLSDANRIFILEAIAKNHKTYVKIFWHANDLLKEYGMPVINPDDVRYHMKTLKEETQITGKSPYELTPEGRLTVKIIEDIASYRM